MTMIAPALPVTDEQRAELRRMANSTVLPHRVAVQAKALLLAADGVADEQVARRCEVDSDTEPASKIASEWVGGSVGA